MAISFFDDTTQRQQEQLFLQRRAWQQHQQQQQQHQMQYLQTHPPPSYSPSVLPPSWPQSVGATTPRYHSNTNTYPSATSSSPMSASVSSSSPSLLLSWSEYSSTIRQLNNRGCTLIMEGNYEEANSIFKLAITRYKQIATSTTSMSSASSSSSSSTRASFSAMSMSMAGVTETPPLHQSPVHPHLQYQEQESVFPDGVYGNYHTHQESSSSVGSDYFEVDDDSEGEDDDDDDDEDMMPMAMTFDSSFPSSTTATTRTARSTTSSVTGQGIRRMTSTSQLLAIPYCGRSSSSAQQEVEEEAHEDDDDDGEHSLYNTHEIYSLPIVMTDEEWEASMMEDKSFVLIYNTALCNHLYGMKVLVLIRNHLVAAAAAAEEEEAIRRKVFGSDEQYRCHHQYHQYHQQAQAQQQERDNEFCMLSETCKHAFEVSKSLYRLAISNVHSIVHGVDALCYVALFNNISHTCKTLYGYESDEAGDYDVLLLKAIFWWRDTNQATSQSSSNSTNQASSSNEGGSATTGHEEERPSSPLLPVRDEHSRIRNSNTSSTTTTNPVVSSSSSSSHSYADTDGEIIDAFLENIFFLIGAQESLVPAAAA